MRILFNSYLALEFPEQVEQLRRLFPEHEMVIAESEAEVFEKLPDTDVLIAHKVTEEQIAEADKLQWVFIPYTGVNLIPFTSLRDKGVQVSNNHGNSMAVAERAVALAFAACGRVPEFDQDLRKGNWHRTDDPRHPFDFWTSLLNKKISILGTGEIARYIAAFLAPFTRNILGFRRREGQPLPEGFSAVTNDLAEAMAYGEICFVTLPQTESTIGLIQKPELELLKGGFLINISRGKIVDEEALFNALSKGLLKGAGIDAWYRYPKPFTADTLPGNLPFHTLKNVVLSPHAASHTDDAKLLQFSETMRNLELLLRTGKPENIVDPASGY